MAANALPRSVLLRIFVPFALGYFLSFLYRVVNTVIAGDLAQDLALDASQLGLLTSAYLIAFAAFQLPLGVLLDRYGPRRVEASLLVFAMLGAAIFAFAEQFTSLVIGRALIGFGVSACLMAAFKAFTQWFPPERLPLANGLQLASGGLGVLVASTPMEWAVQLIGWRHVFSGLSVVTLLVALLIVWVVPEKPIQAQKTSLRQHVASVIAIFRAWQFWQIATISFCIQGTMIAIMSLWAGPWLRDVAGLAREDIASVLSLMAIGVILGYLGAGFLSDWLARRGLAADKVGTVGMLSFMAVEVGLMFEWTALTALLWFLFGFLGTTGSLAYANLSRRFPIEQAGRVNTALNLLVFIFAFLAQWGIGGILNHFSHGNTNQYAAVGYQMAFGMLLGLQVLGMLIYFWPARKV